jgi:hypothetical protein
MSASNVVPQIEAEQLLAPYLSGIYEAIVYGAGDDYNDSYDAKAKAAHTPTARATNRACHMFDRASLLAARYPNEEMHDFQEISDRSHVKKASVKCARDRTATALHSSGGNSRNSKSLPFRSRLLRTSLHRCGGRGAHHLSRSLEKLLGAEPYEIRSKSGRCKRICATGIGRRTGHSVAPQVSRSSAVEANGRWLNLTRK